MQKQFKKNLYLCIHNEQRATTERLRKAKHTQSFIQTFYTMEQKSFEDQIATELCDVLDEPEAYEDCVLGIHKKTHAIAIASPLTLNKDYDTYPLNTFITTNDEGDIDLDLSEISYVASRYE